jgi:hypothetical protein
MKYVLVKLQEGVKKKKKIRFVEMRVAFTPRWRYGAQGDFSRKKNYQHLTAPHTRQFVSFNATFRTKVWKVLLTEPIFRQLKTRIRNWYRYLERRHKMTSGVASMNGRLLWSGVWLPREVTASTIAWRYSSSCNEIKVKVKFTLEQATKAHGGVKV